MKRLLIWPLLASLLLMGSFLGCASTDDLNVLNRNLSQKIAGTDDRVAALNEKLVQVKAAQENVAVEVVKDRKSNEAAIAVLRRNQADSGADVTALKEQIQHLSGQIEDLRMSLSQATAKANQRNEENKEKIDKVLFKVNFIENFLDIGEKKDAGDKTERSGDQNGGAKGKTDKNSLYADAYDAFKEGKYEKARTDFQAFLKQFPNTEHSDDAQFWTGESFYFEKNYEKAILEYEKVIKSYPEGDKVSYALMKQGLSFLKLGDKASAKLILQQVIKDFPNTNQARIARENLLQIN
ncbi:MAG: tol-pal system protein YbgF [Deltaproteobacteria bacterium]|nr:tol-pal system protein YbgF [Deltaproteobacteria bacterium]